MKKLFSTSLLILAGMLLLLGSCKEDELPVSGEGNVANNELPVRLAETDYNPDNTYYLLNDNESQDVYFDSGQRSFYVSRPLQFGMDDEHCFQLRFYSPRALKNVTFWARIDGYEEEFKFMSLEKIMPFQQLRVHIPFATKDLTAYTRSGKKIRIMANPYLTEENLTFTVECDDPYWARLQSIRCKWYIAFGRYSDTQDSWKYKMKASHTREAVAIALNMAYMFSSERFKTALYEFGPLHSNNDKAEIDKTALLANVLNHRGLTFGYTTGVMGLGGGTTFGMHEVCYLEHYADDKSITETIFHEFAHCVGYGHAGNMTYEQTGPGWIDLYFRLAGVCLEVAPLRDRLEDVPLLIANILKRYGKNASVVTPAILDAIRRYSWPGNIRELMSVMESYLVLLGDNSSSLACFEEIFRHRNQFFDKAPQGGTLGEQLAAYRLEIVRKEMRRCAGDRRKAARALGISYSSLRRVLEADAAKDVSVQD